MSTPAADTPADARGADSGIDTSASASSALAAIGFGSAEATRLNWIATRTHQSLPFKGEQHRRAILNGLINEYAQPDRISARYTLTDGKPPAWSGWMFAG